MLDLHTNRAADRLKILIAINHAIKIFDHTRTRSTSLWHRIIHNIISIARCKSQQNVLTAEIKIIISNKNYLRNKSVLKTVNIHNSTLHISQTTTHNKL